ncbi:MAG: hypothetical protein WCI21_03500 [Alphaproteobacteria bacterium]
MMKRWNAAALVLAGLLAAGPALAADYGATVNLPTGTIMKFTIQRSRTVTRAGIARVPLATATFHYRLKIDPNRYGYKVGVTFESMDPIPGMTPEEAASLQKGAAYITGLEFQAGDDLAPAEIIDWASKADGVVGLVADMTGVKRDNPAFEALRNNFKAMSGQAAAEALLKEWTFPAMVQNLEIDLGPASTAEDTQSAGNGLKIKMVQSVQLKSIDRLAGRAVIEFHNGVDPGSANALARTTIEAGQAANPNYPTYTPAQLAVMKIEQSTDCTFEMDTRTGLARKSDCSESHSSIDQLGIVQRQVDHWIITQELAAP